MKALQGVVERLSAKGERAGERGLPKPAVARAEFTASGLKGDFNRYRSERLGSTPDQAVLIMPTEMLTTLNEEFWPVKPGDLGENLTTRGIAYETLGPGLRLAIGVDAIVEISKPAQPCKNLYVLSYVDSMFGPEFIKTLVDRRGWYARVIRPGIVATGDRVRTAD